ncbi:glycosyltransferase family 4 protein [uncultured Psychroserpens sp.]|uniref:glycosyltransferase family 4 protein n=1 Tax=uncultured Psychroserpens sp. TaxID=255436 RepID=UPI00262FAC61|nr:glycosyltransferase family 4 protein [uncultured Psychroserpens sp.]
MILAVLAQSYLFDDSASINGSLVQLYNLTQGLKGKNVEVHYLCLTIDKEKPKTETIDGVHMHWIQSKRGLFEWKRIMPLYKAILEEISPDALYVRGRNVMQYVAGKYAIKHKKVFVWGTNGDDSAEFYKNVKRLNTSKKPLFKKLLLYPLKAFEDVYINKGMKMPDHIVNQNTYQKDQTFKILKREGVILNSYYHIDNADQKKPRNQVLWLARWSKEKQPELFIELISKLKNKQVSFVLAGDTNDVSKRNSIVDSTRKYHIETPGKIAYNDVNTYFSEALVFVNTSYREGVSNTFIEAMLNGVPVLSLNSNPNNWLTDFNIGYCADGDLNELRAVLEDLLNDREKLKIMSEAAKNFAKQQFSNPQTLDSYINLFHKHAKRK